MAWIAGPYWNLVEIHDAGSAGVATCPIPNNVFVKYNHTFEDSQRLYLKVGYLRQIVTPPKI